MKIREDRAERAPAVAQAAAEVQEFTEHGHPAYHYAAGVEDALRWLFGDVSDNVFAHLTGSLGADEKQQEAGRMMAAAAQGKVSS